ncbi:MAG: hypothetical protein ACK587_15280 [Cyanobacteriota bacterium]
MLEIVTAIAGDLEDSGDNLVKEFGHYKLGRKSYQGGFSLGGLVQAVIRFINRWSQTKERVVQLDQKRQEFIEKTKDLPPLPLGGNGHRGSMNQATPTPHAMVEHGDHAEAKQAQEVTADGSAH